MAYAKLTLENPHTGKIKEAPVGFSWTVLFFGFLPPLFRSDWKWAIIIFICSVLTAGFSGFVFMFIYNKLHLKDLLYNGFQVRASSTAANIDMVESRLGIKLPVLEKTVTDRFS